MLFITFTVYPPDTVKLLGEFVVTVIPVPPVKVAGANVPPEFKNPTDLISIITPVSYTHLTLPTNREV